MNLRQRKSNIVLMLIVMAVLALPVVSHAGLLTTLLGGKAKTTTASTTTSTTTSTSTTTASGGKTPPGLLSQLLGSSSTGLLGSLGTGTSTGVGLDTLLTSVLSPVADLTDGLLGAVLNLVNNQVQTVLFTVDVGGVTKSYISIAGNLLNVASPLLTPVLSALTQTGRTVTRLVIPTTSELGRLVGGPTGKLINEVTPNLLRKIIASVNSATGGEIRALLPMPLDPTRTCESCHQSKAALLLAMTDVVNNIKYPGLAADALYVDNFYVAPNYTTLPDSMMSKAAMHPKWEGCKTCHSSGASFDPFPSDNWVPRSNPNDGPEVAKAFGSTNDTSKTCGKCHAANAAAFNKGIMGTHRGHLWGFNFNDVECETTNTESNFFYDPFGSVQAGTDLNRLPLDRNGKRMHAGYFQARKSCSTCHQSCSDCHMTGPGDNPIGILGTLALPKLDPTLLGVDIIDIDRTHQTVAVRLKAMEGTALRRGGVALMEMRKGYIAGISRGLPYSVYVTGMDVKTHKIVKPTTAEQGNVMAPQSQMQSINFCWRCHFRTGAEFVGNWINIVPNLNYEKASLGHLNAGMTCTDCHKWSEMHGVTSEKSQAFNGTSEAADNPSHPGGNPVGSTPKWDITPNPVKATCGLCHTTEGKKLGPSAGLSYGDIVTPRFQTIAKPVKGFATMPVPGMTPTMSHKNVKCEACHTQAQQNCWNCHLEKAETLTGLPLIGTNDLALDILMPIVNVREAEGEPALSAEENALLKEAYAENDAANLNLALTFPTSPNTVNKSVRFLARNNKGQVGSVVHCPGGPTGINNPNRDPQPLNLDGGLYVTKAGEYGTEGAVGDASIASEGSWYMESGHSIARSPDGVGYQACFNCHADTVRLGQEPITYYRKNPWVMKSIGAPEALMPGSHYADGRYRNKTTGGYNCSCHSTTGLVHNGDSVTGPWQLDVLPEPETTPPPPPTDGVALYENKCAVCHGSYSVSVKQGATFDRIKTAIVYLPVMQSLSSMTDEMIHAVAKALGGE